MCNTATIGATEAVSAGESVRPLNQAASGSVALDIGAGRGALVIYPDEAYRDREIEISRVEDDRRVHTGVHERATQAGSVLAAIFGSLPAGEYLIWADASTPGPVVTVSEAAVAELRLS